MVWMSASANADERFASATPLEPADEMGGAHSEPALAARVPPPPAASVRRADPRWFPPFGPLSAAGAPVYPYRFEGHVHTQHSLDAKHPTVEILAHAERLGLDALIITDHGASTARFDFQNYRGKLVPFVGREIGGEFGHAVIWNVSDDAFHDPKRATLQSRAEFAHTHGGLIVFAHPGWWIDGKPRDPMEWMTPDAMRRGGIAGDVDAIELWNGVYRAPLPRLIDAWVRLLEAGVYVPIVGNSDFHRFGAHQLGNAHNIALCDTPEIATCLWPAVREGRVIVTDGPAAMLTVDDRLPGSVLRPSGSELRVSVDALAADGGTLRVYSGTQIVQTLALEPGKRTQGEWQIATPAADSFVRIDIQRPTRKADRPPVSLLSNPVLIDVGEPRRSWR